MAVNNLGNRIDSAGNVAPDFVWGNMAPQPNDERADGTQSYVASGGTTGTTQVRTKTAVVTAASAAAGDVTYTADNSFTVGQTVSITGLSTSAFNLTNVFIKTRTASAFVVTNAATGSAVTGATAVVKGVIGSLPGVGADSGWGTTTDKFSERLNFALDNHDRAQTGYAGFPSYTKALGNFIVTAASGNGTTVTYTSQNYLAAGDSVNITGLTTSAFNLSAATVATVNKVGFTVTSAVGSGVSITGQNGKVEDATAKASGDGSYVTGVAYIRVPSVIGFTVASALDALKDAGYLAADITTSAAVTPAVSSVALTTNVATVLTSAAHGYAVGQSVTFLGFDDVTTDIYSDLNASFTLVAGTTGSTLVFNFTHANLPVNTTSALVGGVTAKVAAKAGLVKTQSVAAGAASIALGTTISIAPYFAS